LHQSIALVRNAIDQKRQHFSVDWSSASEFLVRADATRLQQVFWNLLKNAVKFAPEQGKISVTVSVCPSDRTRILVHVTDNGIGIEPQFLKTIFNVFEQGDSNVNRQFGGLGLGLSIARVLVELHGGILTAQSAGKHQGATFTVNMPLCNQAAAALSSVAVEAEQPPHQLPFAQMRRLRILMVEDDDVTLKIMERLLTERLGHHHVTTARSFQQAMEVSSQLNSKFDLLISDIGLPDGSGLELMRTLREKKRCSLGIALTGFGTDEQIAQSLQAGYSVHLTKPIQLSRLAEAIQKVAALLPTASDFYV